MPVSSKMGSYTLQKFASLLCEFGSSFPRIYAIPISSQSAALEASSHLVFIIFIGLLDVLMFLSSVVRYGGMIVFTHDGQCIHMPTSGAS
jgi:hypothetical protein